MLSQRYSNFACRAGGPRGDGLRKFSAVKTQTPDATWIGRSLICKPRCAPDRSMQYASPLEILPFRRFFVTVLGACCLPRFAGGAPSTARTLSTLTPKQGLKPTRREQRIGAPHTGRVSTLAARGWFHLAQIGSVGTSAGG